MRGLAAAVVLLVLLPFGPAQARAASPIALDPAQSYSLFRIARARRDGGPWTAPGAFTPSHRATSFSRVTIDLALSVRGDPAVPWVIRVPMQVDAIALIDPHGPTIRTGMGMPLAQRPDPSRIPLLLVPPHLLDGTPFIVRLYTSTEVRSPRLMTVAASQAEDDATRAVTFFFIGFFIAVGLVFALLYWNLRERGLIIYSLVMLSLANYEWINKAYAWYAWPNLGIEWHIPNALSFWLYCSALVAFCAAFLNARGVAGYARTIAFGLLAMILITQLAGAVAHDVAGMVPIEDAVSLLLLVTLLGWAIVAYRDGQRSARYYIIAFAGVFAGIAINRLALDQIIPHNGFTEWTFEIGIAWEAVWLALGIASALQETTRENALLHASEIHLQRLATIDGLTGVANRRAFDDRLQAEWNRAARNQRGLALLFADVDFFKQYNDSHGHLAGDDALRRIAFAISSFALRSSDLCARYGGEEFAVLVAEADPGDAATLAEAIRAEVQQLAIPHPLSPMRYVTISIGVATASPAAGGNPMRLIADADRALYRAKNGGRNAVAIADLVAD